MLVGRNEFFVARHIVHFLVLTRHQRILALESPSSLNPHTYTPTTPSLELLNLYIESVIVVPSWNQTKKVINTAPFPQLTPLLNFSRFFSSHTFGHFFPIDPLTLLRRKKWGRGDPECFGLLTGGAWIQLCVPATNPLPSLSLSQWVIFYLSDPPSATHIEIILH